MSTKSTKKQKVNSVEKEIREMYWKDAFKKAYFSAVRSADKAGIFKCDHERSKNAGYDIYSDSTGRYTISDLNGRLELLDIQSGVSRFFHYQSNNQTSDQTSDQTYRVIMDDMYRLSAENDKTAVLKSKSGKLSLDAQYQNALIMRHNAHNDRDLITAENTIARLEKLIANRYAKDHAFRLANAIAEFANNMELNDSTYCKSIFELIPRDKWIVWAGVQSLTPVAGYAGVNTGYLSVAEAEIHHADDFIRTACKNTHIIKRVDDMIHFRRLKNKGREHIDVLSWMKENTARIDKKRIK